MKKIFFFILFCILFFSLQAQEIDIEKYTEVQVEITGFIHLAMSGSRTDGTDFHYPGVSAVVLTGEYTGKSLNIILNGRKSKIYPFSEKSVGKRYKVLIQKDVFKRRQDKLSNMCLFDEVIFIELIK